MGVSRAHAIGHHTARPPCCIRSHLQAIARGSPGPFATHPNPRLPMPCNTGPDHGVARLLGVLPSHAHTLFHPTPPTRTPPQNTHSVAHPSISTLSLTRAHSPALSPMQTHPLSHTSTFTLTLTQARAIAPSPKRSPLLRARFARSCGSASRWRRFKPDGGPMCRW